MSDIIVHRTECEGAITVDRETGIITTPMNERPDWAEGLAVAHLAERLGFWNTRLGKLTPEMIRPDMVAFEDLGWTVAEEDGSPGEIAADTEFRLNALAEMMGHGLDLDAAGETTMAPGYTVVAEVQVDDGLRDTDEVAAYEQAQKAGFKHATG